VTRSLPRWVHRNLPRAAPPDSWRSLRSARVPPVHYLDKLPRPSLGATSLNPGVQFSMSKRVQFRRSVDRPRMQVGLGARRCDDPVGQLGDDARTGAFAIGRLQRDDRTSLRGAVGGEERTVTTRWCRRPGNRPTRPICMPAHSRSAVTHSSTTGADTAWRWERATQFRRSMSCGSSLRSPFFTTRASYDPQNALTAACNADTLGNPRSAAASSMPPNAWASAEMLWP
jgi:hypothetical protein